MCSYDKQLLSCSSRVQTTVRVQSDCLWLRTFDFSVWSRIHCNHFVLRWEVHSVNKNQLGAGKGNDKLLSENVTVALSIRYLWFPGSMFLWFSYISCQIIQLDTDLLLLQCGNLNNNLSCRKPWWMAGLLCCPRGRCTPLIQEPLLWQMALFTQRAGQDKRKNGT